MTEDNENVPCARCGIPIGEQGEIALVKGTLIEREYFCEICKPGRA